MNRPRIVSGILTALILLTACAGLEARKNVLIPTMELMWPSIVASIGSSSPEVEAMTVALKSRDIDKVLLANWDLLRSLALAGIQARLDAGEIGPGVAESLQEGVRLFDESFRRL